MKVDGGLVLLIRSYEEIVVAGSLKMSKLLSWPVTITSYLPISVVFAAKTRK